MFCRPSRRPLTVLTIALSLALFACKPNDTPSSDGGSVDDGASAQAACKATFAEPLTISGLAFKGLVKSAMVEVSSLVEYQGDSGNNTYRGYTPVRIGFRRFCGAMADGRFEIAIEPKDPIGCLLIEIEGDDNCGENGTVYEDEATGVDVRYQQGLAAIICDLSSEIGPIAVTPLTTIAARRALWLATPETLCLAGPSSNRQVAQQFGLPSLLDTLPVDITDQAAVSTATTEQRRYGLVIAGLSQLAKNVGAHAIDLTEALADDLNDGLLDGQRTPAGNAQTATEIKLIDGTTKPLGTAAGLQQIQQAIDQLAGSNLNKSGLSELKISTTPIKVGVVTADRVYIATSALPAWVSALSASHQLRAQGGREPYSWALAAGTPPTGFSLDNTGAIAGSMTLAPGSTRYISPPFTVKVTDAVGATDQATLRISVVAPPPQLEIASCPTGKQNEAYSCQVAQAQGGNPPYHFVLGTAGGFPPPGTTLSIDGIVSGTPTAGGRYTFDVCAVDLIGSRSCAPATITISTTPSSDFAGSWSGTYSYSGKGDGGCTYQSNGTLTITLTVDGPLPVDGGAGAATATGSMSISGWQLRLIPSCQHHSYQSASGSFAGTIAAGRVFGTLKFSALSNSISLALDAVLTGGTTMTGTLQGGGSGTFTLTKQ